MAETVVVEAMIATVAATMATDIGDFVIAPVTATETAARVREIDEGIDRANATVAPVATIMPPPTDTAIVSSHPCWQQELYPPKWRCRSLFNKRCLHFTPAPHAMLAATATSSTLLATCK